MRRVTIAEYDGYIFLVGFNDKDKQGKWKKQPPYCVAIEAKDYEEAKTIVEKMRYNGTLG